LPKKKKKRKKRGHRGLCGLLKGGDAPAVSRKGKGERKKKKGTSLVCVKRGKRKKGTFLRVIQYETKRRWGSRDWRPGKKKGGGGGGGPPSSPPESTLERGI